MTVNLREEIDIDRPAADVWELVADYRRDPEWRADVITMAPRPPSLVQVGTTTNEEMRFAGRTMHNAGEVMAVEAGRRFTWRTTSGVDASGARTVMPLGPDGCRIVLELRVTPHGAQRLMAPVTARVLARTVRRDLATLKALAESADPVRARRHAQV